MVQLTVGKIARDFFTTSAWIYADKLKTGKHSIKVMGLDFDGYEKLKQHFATFGYDSKIVNVPGYNHCGYPVSAGHRLWVWKAPTKAYDRVDIKELVAEHGKDHLVFKVPMQRGESIFGFVTMTSADAPREMVDAIINEERYKVADGHKITLQATDETYGHEHFYQMDLESLIRDGQISYEVRA